MQQNKTTGLRFALVGTVNLGIPTLVAGFYLQGLSLGPLGDPLALIVFPLCVPIGVYNLVRYALWRHEIDRE